MLRLFGLASLLAALAGCEERAPRVGEPCHDAEQWCSSSSSGLFCDADRKWAKSSCSDGCGFSAHDALFDSNIPKAKLFACHQRLAKPSEPCAVIGAVACARDGKHALTCDPSHRFAILRECPGGCSSTQSPDIECTLPQVREGVSCPNEGELACEVGGKRLLRCEKGISNATANCPGTCKASVYLGRGADVRAICR